MCESFNLFKGIPLNESVEGLVNGSVNWPVRVAMNGSVWEPVRVSVSESVGLPVWESVGLSMMGWLRDSSSEGQQDE